MPHSGPNATNRRQLERIRPKKNAEPAERLKDQTVVALNIAGPGPGHCPRSAFGIAVKLLSTGNETSSFTGCSSPGVPYFTFSTHYPVPLFASGVCQDREEAKSRIAKLVGDFEKYQDSQDSKFEQRYSNLEVVQEPKSDEEPGDTKASGAAGIACAGSFFVVSFVPEVLSDGSLSHSQPLLCVFGKFDAEESAEGYGRMIAERYYPRLDIFVVQGGQWIYPRMLDTKAADSIPTLFPDAPKIEALVKGIREPFKLSDEETSMLQNPNLFTKIQ